MHSVLLGQDYCHFNKFEDLHKWVLARVATGVPTSMSLNLDLSLFLTSNSTVEFPTNVIKSLNTSDQGVSIYFDESHNTIMYLVGKASGKMDVSINAPTVSLNNNFDEVIVYLANLAHAVGIYYDLEVDRLIYNVAKAIVLEIDRQESLKYSFNL